MACTLKQSGVGTDFGSRTGSGTFPAIQTNNTQAPTNSTSSTTQSGSGTGTGTVKLTIREPNAAPIIKNLSGAFASYMDIEVLLSKRSFYVDSSKVYTKAELTKQSDCPVDCNDYPNDVSCKPPPPCTLGAVTVSWSFCAEDDIKDYTGYSYTSCIAAIVESGNVVEYEDGELNIVPGEYPKMGSPLPYLNYATISRCEKRSGDAVNKIYYYTAAKEGTKNGHFGSLDFVRFDKEVPTNSNNPLISFKLTGGRFVEQASSDTSSAVYFGADIDAVNVPVVFIPQCKPR